MASPFQKQLDVPLKKSARVVESSQQPPKHKCPGLRNKKSQIVFAGYVGVWEVGGTKSIFLN